MKKIITYICLILVLMLCSQIIYADESLKVYAKELSKSAVITVSDTNEKLNALNDGARSTKYTFEKRNTIKITAQEPIASIYVQFNKPPQQWTLLDNKQSVICGNYGFLHEFVSLSATQTEIQLTFPQNTSICEIQIFSYGEVPSYIEKWEPPLDDADMLLIPTHADDEHLFFGGIMPYYAGELKKKVQVAYLTNHNGEWYRPHELLAGLWHVGVTAYPVIPEQFNDYYSASLEHAKTLYDTEAMLDYMTMLLRRFKPEVVIGHDVNGEYGHGVHMLNTHLLMQALEISNDAAQFPESANRYGAFDVPKTYLHLYDKNQLIMDIDIPLANFENKTAYEMAQEGFAKHQSQTKYFTVEKSGPYDCRIFGLYRSTVGDDILHKDFFENIKEKPIEQVVETKEPEEKEEPQTSSEQNLSSTETKDNNFSGSILIILGIIVCILTLRVSKRKKHK